MNVSPNTTWIPKMLKINIMFDPHDNYDINHYDCLTKLMSNLYKKHNNKPCTKTFQFAHMWDTNKNPDGELYYPVLITEKDNEWYKILNELIDNYSCEIYQTQHYIYVSPMSNWELTDFWENLDADSLKILQGEI